MKVFDAMPNLHPVNERTSAQDTATLTDHAGVTIVGSLLETLTLTLYDEATGIILNNRNQQNVLQTNGVTVSEAGRLTCILAPADNAIIGGTAGHERHVMLFHADGSIGQRELYHRAVIFVRRLDRVPAV